MSTGSATWMNSWISLKGSSGSCWCMVIFLLPLGSDLGDLCRARSALALWLSSTRSKEERIEASLQLGCAPLSSSVRTVSASGWSVEQASCRGVMPLRLRERSIKPSVEK